MKRAIKSKISIKDLTLYIIVSVNLLATVALGVIVFKDMSHDVRKSIIQTKVDLVQHAKIECMKETGGTDCDYVELNQRLLDEYIESVNTK